ncbi:hypothetical protein [Corynebacterium matruchotii]|uniref:hypothetical protein n=1 Tax=Corynebacterium matruchotii TaxID=43768 RepID=UPI0028F1640D|nr:hypothetical protein [Corynebacterium matruchotii]
MRHIIPQFVESGILSLPTLLDDATQGALPACRLAGLVAWVAARRGLVAGRCGLVRGQPGGLAAPPPHPRPGSIFAKHGV